MRRLWACGCGLLALGGGLVGCARGMDAADVAARVATGVAATVAALPTTISPPAATPPSTALPAPAVQPAAQPPTATPPPAVLVEPPPGVTPRPLDASETGCEARFQVRLFAAPQVQPAFFEHHPAGIFLALPLELTNVSAQAVQVWDGDYQVEERLPDGLRRIGPRHDATGYLYNQYGLNWYQERLAPEQAISTWVVFDASPQAQHWTLILQPGGEGGAALCELRLELPPPLSGS